MTATNSDYAAAVAKLTLADQESTGTSFSADQARAILAALPTNQQGSPRTRSRWSAVTVATLVIGWVLLAVGTFGHDLHRLVAGSFMILLAWIDVAAEGIVDAIRRSNS